MAIGLFVRRELIVSTRRGTAFSERRGSVLLTSVIVAGWAIAWDWCGWDRASVGGASSFGLSTFAWIVATQAILAVGLVPALVAPSIASERDRKSLDSLLVTRLAAWEIVLGAMGAGLLRYANGLAALAPVLVLVVFLGGVDPRLVLPAVLGLASTALAVASLTIAASATSRTASRAAACSVGLAMMWMCMPQAIVMLLPRVWPAVVPWVAPIAVTVLDSSPLGVALTLLGVLGRGPLSVAVPRMIALQMAASVCLVSWAVIRLRPASRAVHDAEARRASYRWRFLRARWRPRPPCGDDPVLWHEMYAGVCCSSVELWAGRIFHASWVGVLAYWISWFALPAFAELYERGYGPFLGPPAVQDVNVIARVLVGKVMRLSTGPAPGKARVELNYVLRTVTGLLVALNALMIAGVAAESIAAERERQTWHGLIATPLTGEEILRGKLLGSIWRTRGLAVLVLGLWAMGGLAGAVHPIGLLAALATLCVSTCFLATIGVVVSLRSRDRAQATGRAIGPLLLLLGVGSLPFFFPGPASVLLAGFTTPFQTWASLLSYEDVQAATNSGVIPQFMAIGIRDGAGAGLILVTWLISMAVQGVGAHCLFRSAVRDFDAVGRGVSTRDDG